MLQAVRGETFEACFICENIERQLFANLLSCNSEKISMQRTKKKLALLEFAKFMKQLSLKKFPLACMV